MDDDVSKTTTFPCIDLLLRFDIIHVRCFTLYYVDLKSSAVVVQSAQQLYMQPK